MISKTAGRIVVSTSWGKDSVCLVDLARRVLGDVDLMHIASPAVMPGTDRVADAMVGQCPYHVISQHDLAGYVAWVRSVGLPHERTRARQNSAVAAIKKDPAIAWALEHEFDGVALGMRAEENPGTRGMNFRVRGATYMLKSGIRIINPIAWWSGRDVWAYIFSRGLPYNNRIYDAETHGLTRETIRNTGWLSTDGAAMRGRIAWLRHHFPDQYRRLALLFPEVRSLC